MIWSKLSAEDKENSDDRDEDSPLYIERTRGNVILKERTPKFQGQDSEWFKKSPKTTAETILQRKDAMEPIDFGRGKKKQCGKRIIQGHGNVPGRG